MNPSQIDEVLMVRMAGGEMETQGFKKRFGTIAIEKGFVTKEQLAEALKTQVLEEVEQGQHRLIGAILHEEGFMTFPQLQEVLESLQIMSGV